MVNHWYKLEKEEALANSPGGPQITQVEGLTYCHLWTHIGDEKKGRLWETPKLNQWYQHSRPFWVALNERRYWMHALRISKYITSVWQFSEKESRMVERKATNCCKVERFLRKPNWHGETKWCWMKSAVWANTTFSRTFEIQQRREIGL